MEVIVDRDVAILDEVYDLINVETPFKATQLIGKVNCISHLHTNTQHRYLLSALKLGREHGTVRKEGKRFILSS